MNIKENIHSEINSILFQKFTQIFQNIWNEKLSYVWNFFGFHMNLYFLCFNFFLQTFSKLCSGTRFKGCKWHWLLQFKKCSHSTTNLSVANKVGGLMRQVPRLSLKMRSILHSLLKALFGTKESEILHWTLSKDGRMIPKAKSHLFLKKIIKGLI